MKKTGMTLILAMLLMLTFSFASCTHYENGVPVKYATMKLAYTDEDGKAKEEDIAIKLYTNLNTANRFAKLASDGFYENTVVNTIESGWFSLGGYTLEGNALTVKSSGQKIEGEFVSNGVSGNSRYIKKGTVLMYREVSNRYDREVLNDNNWNSADCRFVICTSTSATPYNASDYCLFGEVMDDDLDILDEIAALRYRQDEDSDETDYNYYYVGGLDTLAAWFMQDGRLTEDALDNNIAEEDVEALTEGELAIAPGFVDDEVYDDIMEYADKFIKAIGSHVSEYFYCVPYNTVTIKSIKITSKI